MHQVQVRRVQTDHQPVGVVIVEQHPHQRPAVGRGGAEDQADDDADRGQRQDLRHVDLEDQAPGRAQAFQRGDGRRLAVEIAAHRVADADAADQQGGEPDQGEEEGEAVDEAADARRRLRGVADAPAGFGKDRAEGGPHGLCRQPLVEPQAIVVLHQAAGLDQPGFFQAVVRHHEGRAEGEGPRGAVRFALQHRGDAIVDLADPHQVAQCDVEAAQQAPVDHRAPMATLGAVALGERFAEVRRAGHLDAAEEGVEAVDGAQFYQYAARIGRRAAGHGAHLGDARDLGPGLQEALLLGAGRHVGQAQVHIPAEQNAAVALEAGEHGLRDRADAGDGRDAEGQAGEEDAKALEAAAQLAAGEAQGERPAGPLAGGAAGGCLALRQGGHETEASARPDGPLATSPTMRPSSSFTERAQRAGQFRVVGDQHQGGAVLGLQVEQQVDDLMAGLAVQIAGRLVGQQQVGRRSEGAGERGALLLAAGELTGVVGQAVAEADRLETLGRAVEGVGPPGEFQGNGDVLQRRHGRHQVEVLKHDAHGITAEAGQAVLVQAVEARAADRDGAFGGALQPGDDHHHGGLAGAGRSHDADGFAAPDGEVQPAQDVHGPGCRGQGQLDAVEPDHGVGGGGDCGGWGAGNALGGAVARGHARFHSTALMPYGPFAAYFNALGPCPATVSIAPGSGGLICRRQALRS